MQALFSLCLATWCGMDLGKKQLDVEFGHRLKVLIDLRKITQTQFAARVGLSETSVSLVINGKRGMSKTKKLQAATLLDVHPLTLTTEKNISDDQLTLYSMFVRILDNPDAYRSYPAIKTLIESEFSK